MKMKKHTKQSFITKKFVLIILVIISLTMTSSTFAYWAGSIEGTTGSYSTSFIVGSPLFDDHEFVLNSKVDTYSYSIPLDDLLDDPENNTDEIVFGIIWNDEDLSDELKDKIASGEIELTYTFNITKDGSSVNKSKYNRLSKLIEVSFSDDNPEDIAYGNIPTTFEILLSLTDENQNNDYKLLARHDVELIISFEIDDIEYN